MDYEKTQPKATPERPSSATPKTKSSAVKTKPKASRPRTAAESGRAETPVAETAPVPPPEQKIQDANENYAETKLAEAEENDSLLLKAEPDIIVDDNCEVSERPSTANSDKSNSSDNSETKRSKLPKRVSPDVPKSSLEPDDEHNGNEEYVDGTAVEEDQPIDIICSQLETVDQRPGSPRQIPYDDDSMDQVEAELTRRGRTFKKQIIKYEYKEEVVVNGTANFQLPRQQHMNTAAKNGGPHVIKGGYDLV